MNPQVKSWLRAGWVAQTETLRLWHRRASIDRVAERCSAPTRPWGQPWAAGSYVVELNFAGMGWHDTESSLDWTPGRFYESRLGRWISPDPAGVAAADPSNPQSFNQYAYVLNNPTSNIDPLGLDGCDPEFDTVCPGSGSECSITDAECNPGMCDPDVACSPNPPGGEGGAIPPGVGSGGYPPAGLGGIGIWGGGMGSGPLSGDYGVGLPPLSGGGGLPCDFGTCSGVNVPGSNGFAPAAAAAVPAVGACLASGVCEAVAGGILVGVVVGAGAAALQHYIQNRGEQKMIRDVARGVGVDARELGDAVEAYKRIHGIPDNVNLSYAEMWILAEEVKQGVWKGTK